MKKFTHLIFTLATWIAFAGTAFGQSNSTSYQTLEVNGIEIFYREAGPKDAPTLLLLHGYPTSSYMYRDLISELADEFHLIAPDYPAFGRSEQPSPEVFDYTFDNLASLMEEFVELKGLTSYGLYIMDYGAPIGFRLATKHPERIESLIIQNGNAYLEGLEDFWNPIRGYWEDGETNAGALAAFTGLEGTRWQYIDGVQDSTLITPDTWEMDLRHLTRPGNTEIQLALFYDYQNNLKLYPEWQAYLREYQPRTLIIWGENDYIFPASGALAYRQDLKEVEIHLYDTGHFALETHAEEMAGEIRSFYYKTNYLSDRLGRK